MGTYMRNWVITFTTVLALACLPQVALAQQDDCPAGHVRHPQVSPLDHDYMTAAFKASFRGLFGRDPSMQPGSGKDDGEYYIAAANHYGVYGDDQCHAGWSGYWESWLAVGHGDLTLVQSAARFLPTAALPPVVLPPPPPVPPVVILPSTDLSPVLNQQAIDHAVLLQLQTELAAARKDIADFREAVRSKWVAIVDSPVFKYGLAVISGWLVTRATK